MQLVPLQNGSMLFGAADPAFGIIDPQGRARTLQGPGQFDFRNWPGSLRLSRNGKAVEIGTINPSRTLRFSLSQRAVELDPLPDDTLAGPVTDEPGLSVSKWQNDDAPTVTGKPI